MCANGFHIGEDSAPGGLGEEVVRLEGFLG